MRNNKKARIEKMVPSKNTLETIFLINFELGFSEIILEFLPYKKDTFITSIYCFL